MYQPFQNQGKEEEVLKFSSGSYFSRLNFARSFLKLCGKLNNNTSADDLPNPTLSQNCSKRARRIMKHMLDGKSPFMSFVRQFKWETVVYSFLVILDFVIKIFNSILMGTIIRFLTSDQQELKEDYSHQVVFGVFFTLLFIGIYPKIWVFQYGNSLGAKLRFTITHLVHMKVSMVSNFQLQKYGVGKLMNLISNDLNDLQSGIIWLFQLFLLPITLSIGTYALWRAFGWYSICGIIVLIISLKIQDTITKSVKAPLQQKNKLADKRIYYSKQLIKNIKAIKMYVLQKKLIDIINDFRQKQIGFNFNVMLNQAISKLLSYSSIMITILSMVIFRLIFQQANLNKQSIYAAIGILGVIRNTNFNGGLNYLTITRIITERTEAFLNLKVVPQRRVLPIEYISSVSNDIEIERIAMNARLKLPEYKTQKSSQDVFLFRNVDKKLIGSLNLKTHSRVFIVGDSGSGKTAVVEAFLKQSQFYNVQNLKGKLAYVPQEPVLFNGTVKSNITFGKPYNEQKFDEVVRLCELTKDMLIFPEGAETKVTMQGSSFSGGQRARIGIARALYSDADIFLMDNCLSALDPIVRKLIHRNLFGQRFKNKIIIFSTSNDSQLLDESFVIRMDDRKIDWFNVYQPEIRTRSKSNIQLTEQKQTVTTKVLPPPPSPVEEMLEQSDKGKITKDTYLYYLKHLGNDYKGVIKALVILTLFILCQLSALGFYKNLPELGTNTWATLKLVGNYITMYFCLDYLRSYVMVVLASTNSIESHKDFIKHIGYAKYEWYSKRESELTNVFANHVGIVDRPLPNILYDVVKGLLSNFIYLLNLCIVTPAFIPIAVILAVGLWIVKHFLQKYIRKCKMLQLKYRSPVYNKLAQHFSGVILVRNYGVERQFEQEFAVTAYESQKTYFSFLQINRFLDLILQFILFLMIVLGVTLTLFFSANSSNSNLALSMFTLINMTSQLSYIIRQTITVELNLISLQKLRSYNSTPIQSINEDIEKHTYIPMPKGEIMFENVRMKYPGASSYCLNNLNLTINQGEKVAIMGRTGAGKSSIFLALYRMYELQPGSVIKVGGVDINSVDLYTLRKNWLSCSAQDALRLPPLTSTASPTQLKYQSIVNQNRTPIKLLDQPFANIDDNLEMKIWDHINSLSTVLAVVHSGDLTKWTRIITMRDGEVADDSGPAPQAVSDLHKSVLQIKTNHSKFKKQVREQQYERLEKTERELMTETNLNIASDKSEEGPMSQEGEVDTPDRLNPNPIIQESSQSLLKMKQ